MPKSKFEGIYKRIKRRIEQQKYPYGELLPSENTFVVEFECSRNTIRRALAYLTEEGYVQPIHGKGVRVIYQPTTKTNFIIGGIETFKETAHRNNLNYTTKVILFEEIETDSTFSIISGFPVGTKLYHIERVRYLDNKALIIDVNYFSKELVPNLTVEIAEKSIYEYIETKLHVQIVTSKRTITIEHISEEDTKHLDMNGYDCLAIVSSQTFNSDGILFEYTKSKHQPEYFTFQDTATRKR